MLAVLSKAPADGDRGEKRLQVRVEFAGYEEAAVLDAASQTRHASADSREYVGSCSACSGHDALTVAPLSGHPQAHFSPKWLGHS